MIALLALAAAAAVSYLHWKPVGTGPAAPFPSLQILRGRESSRRRVPRVEQPALLAIRLAAIAAAAAALTLASKAAPRDPVTVAVDPSSGDAARTAGSRRLADLRSAAIDAIEGARWPELLPCPERDVECFWNRVVERPGPLHIVSSFSEPAWRIALSARPRAFTYDRVETIPRPEVTAPPAAATLPFRVVDDSSDSTARLLAEAVRTVAAGSAPLPSISVGNARAARSDLPRLALVEPGERAPGIPPLAPRSNTAIELAEDEALAAGSRVLDLPGRWRFEEGPGIRILAGGVLAQSTDVVFIAAGGDEIAGWWASGSLERLVRVAVGALISGRGTLPALALPNGPAERWAAEPSGREAPLGILDVPPGRYRRADGRFERTVPERPAVAGGPLTGAELSRLGGRPGTPAPPAGENRAILPLFALALTLAAADGVAHRRPLSALLASAVAIAIALGWAADWQRRTAVTTKRAAVVRQLPPAEAERLAAALAREGISASRGPAGGSGTAILARIGGPDSGAGVDAILERADRPSVAITRVALPREVRIGERAVAVVEGIVSGGAGKTLTIDIRASAAIATPRHARIESAREAFAISVPVTPATAGIGYASVEARLDADGGASDAAVVPLAVRDRARRFLVAALAPEWDARVIAAALRTEAGAVETATALGRTAVASRGGGADPLALLSDAERLREYQLVGVVENGELPAPARRSLNDYVESGGALLAITGVGSEASRVANPAPLTGEMGSRRFEFRGFVPNAAAPLEPAVELASVIDASGKRHPWIVGRRLGLGRRVDVLAPDLWRAGGPASGTGESLDAVVRGAVGWLLTTSRAPAYTLSPDLTSLVVESETTRRVPLPAPGPVEGLAVEARDPLTLSANPRFRARVDAARRGRCLIVESDARALASAIARVPSPPRTEKRFEIRKSSLAWIVWLAAAVSATAIRRRPRPAAEEAEARSPALTA